MSDKGALGIIGGMGPLATVIFMQRLISLTNADDDQDHLPMIVLNMPQIPSRIDAIIHNQGDDPEPHLMRMASSLEGQGATAIAMPCNTAHYYAHAIRSAVGIPFYDMIALTVESLRTRPGLKKVGMLISPACRQVEVFEAPLARAGLEPVYLEDDHRLLSVIQRVKAGDLSDGLIRDYQALADELVQRGASVQHLLVGCTELSCLPLPDRAGVTSTDSMDVLARHVITSILGESRLAA